jgi:hypothetical protein
MNKSEVDKLKREALGDAGASPAKLQEIHRQRNAASNAFPQGDRQWGLTKREHFAGLAMQGFLATNEVAIAYAGGEPYKGNENQIKSVAEASVRCADALLAALEPQGVTEGPKQSAREEWIPANGEWLATAGPHLPSQGQQVWLKIDDEIVPGLYIGGLFTTTSGQHLCVNLITAWGYRTPGQKGPNGK